MSDAQHVAMENFLRERATIARNEGREADALAIEKELSKGKEIPPMQI